MSHNLGLEIIRDHFSMIVRSLEDENDSSNYVLWEMIYVVVVLFGMFVALVMDRIGPDMVMVSTLTLFMVSGIISVEEGLAGFSNEGILTVIVLIVVAGGVGHTGALDWYMGKLLGKPETIANSQMRLMVPILLVSAFLNNTPVVALMIPIIQRWSKNIGFSSQQLLIPLSYASILGGTCTLIGTSTNLVVMGLYKEKYPDEPQIGLFDLSIYGVPIALIGLSYILLFSPCLLPNISTEKTDTSSILLRARLMKWSSAVGRSVKRSGLRDTGGIYLVSVQRAATGNIHRAVGQDFVLNVGDILYFTALIEEFGQFCLDHGLEVLTNENESKQHLENMNEEIIPQNTDSPSSDVTSKVQNSNISNNISSIPEEVFVGTTKESIMMDETERLQCIHKITDRIRGITPIEKSVWFQDSTHIKPPQVIVAGDDRKLVLLGIDAPDRPGLLLDISKTLLRLNLQLHHTEATVHLNRSLSVWRCEPIRRENIDIDVEEVLAVLNALLESEGNVQAVKQRGLHVIRAMVTEESRLCGKNAIEVNFHETYKAAIVSILKHGEYPLPSEQSLSYAKLDSGDILILQVNHDSPLLERPDVDFYEKLNSTKKKTFSYKGFVELVRNVSKNSLTIEEEEKDQSELRNITSPTSSSPSDEYGNYKSFDSDASFEANVSVLEEGKQEFLTAIWTDLQVLHVDVEGGMREFLTAMEVSRQSQLINKTAVQLGLDKLVGIYLVSIERPFAYKNNNLSSNLLTLTINNYDHNSDSLSEAAFTNTESTATSHKPINVNDTLNEGDVLWFSGSANALGELRKIPGLTSYESDEVKQIEGKVYDRRLVEAVIARKGPLVGKTVLGVKFRTKYGAAVIAIHREGKRIHQHPGRVTLQAGDVLLLEAGPTFIERNAHNDRSFVLLSEVEDSAPPRLRLFIPALTLMIAMLAIYTAGLASLLVLALIASITMVAIGVLSEQEVRDAINWEIYITIGCAFGIGTALTNSGVAAAVANFLVNIGTAIGVGFGGLYASVYFATFLLSSVVTNNAAAALLFPIAMDVSDQVGASRLIMSYNVMLAASASFMTPFGYQTNLMVYGPGKYKTTDFLKFGTPLQIVLLFLTVILLSIPNQWYICWVITFLVLVLVFIISIAREKSRFCCGNSNNKTLSQCP